MRLGATKTGATTTYNGLGDQLYDIGGARPTLDLNFASNESLVDSVTGKTLVTHTRATNATYVDGDGIIKDAVTNLVTYSQDATQWTTTDSTVTNTTVEAPDNSLTAISFEEDLVTAPHVVRTPGVTTVVANTQYTMSVFAKKGVRDYITLQADSSRYGLSTATKKTFNISNGTLGDTNGTTDNAAITAVGNGWYRCSVTFTSGASPSGTGQIKIFSNNNSDVSNNKAGISGVALYIWGAQLEEASTAGEYVKTTSTINSAPRFDHDPVTGESLGLLAEESRENLITYSEDLTEWTAHGSAAVTANNATAPDNSATADKLEQVTHEYDGRRTAVSISTSTTYTVSAFIKPVDQPRSRVGIIHSVDGWFAHLDTNWDASGTPSTNGSSGASNITYENYGNNWYRVSYNFTSPSSISSGETRVIVQPDRTGSQKSIYFWGAQLEAGSFPTSYIRTSGSTATRTDDVLSITGTNFSSWYNQTESTVAVSWNKPWSGNWVGYRSFFSVIQAANSAENFIHFGITNGGGNNQIYWSSEASNVGQLSYKQYPAGGPNRFKHAIAVANNDAAFSHAGDISSRTDNSVTLPTVDKARIYNVNSHVSRITYWPTRLSNDTLNRITA